MPTWIMYRRPLPRDAAPAKPAVQDDFADFASPLRAGQKRYG
jgi:hypothetical protein